MRTLNDEFDQYRDCLRLVWNYALRGRSTSADSFDAVNAALLKALVLDALLLPDDAAAARSEAGYVPGLGFALTAQVPEVLVPRESEDEVVWDRVSAGHDPRGTQFYFVEVFDFRDFEQMHDFEYVKAVAKGACGDVVSGTTVALRRSDVDVVDFTGG